MGDSLVSVPVQLEMPASILGTVSHLCQVGSQKYAPLTLLVTCCCDTDPGLWRCCCSNCWVDASLLSCSCSC